MDEGHVIDVLRHAGEDRRNPRSRLPTLLPGEGRLHQRPDLIDEEAGLVVEALEFLPVALRQLRLVVPGIDLAGTAVHEQPDDRLRLGGEVRLLRRQRMEDMILGGEQALLIEEAGQSERAEAAAGAAQESAARRVERVRRGDEMGVIHGETSKNGEGMIRSSRAAITSAPILP